MNQPKDSKKTSRIPTIFIIAISVALVLSVSSLLVPTLSVVLLIFAGLLFGVLTHSLAAWPAKNTRISYRTSYLVVVTLIVLAIAGGCMYFGGLVVERADDFSDQLRTSIAKAEAEVRKVKFINEYLPDPTTLQNKLLASTDILLPRMLSGLQTVGWGLTGFLVIFFVGLYAANDPDLYRTGLIKLVPIHRRDRAGEVLDQLRDAMVGWIIGRFASMTLVGISTAIGLWWMGVPLPITLGFLAALLTFVPNIGPLLSAVPQMLLAINVGTDTVFYVLVFNIVLQTVESYLFTPIIQSHEVSLPPILTITAQLLMGIIVGIVGMMMAAPLVVVMMVLLQMLYIEDHLGDSHPGQLTED